MGVNDHGRKAIISPNANELQLKNIFTMEPEVTVTRDGREETDMSVTSTSREKSVKKRDVRSLQKDTSDHDPTLNSMDEKAVTTDETMDVVGMTRAKDQVSRPSTSTLKNLYFSFPT